MAIKLINEELSVTESIPNGEFGDIKTKTFLDVAKWLTNKYKGSIESHLGTNLGNVISRSDRAPIKFEVLANDGQFASISYSENVGEWDAKTDQIFFIIEPVGGSITLYNNELNVREEIPNNEFGDIEEKTFLDVAKWLSKKYKSSIEEHLGSNLGNVIDDVDRAPIKFELEENGESKTISYNELVHEIDKKTNKVNFIIEPIGGVNNPTFNQHAYGIIRNRKFVNWKPLIANNVSDGIFAVGRVKNERIARTFRVMPSANYPRTEPIITSNPPFSNDPCWDSSGRLHYTNYSNKGGSPWTRLVERHQNPLISIIDELLTKYKMSV